MINLLDLDVDGLARLFAEMGEKPFRARQVSRWLHQRFVDDIAAMTDLARPLRERLAGVAVIRGPAVIRDSTAADGTRKWLLDVGGGNAVEAVYIPEDDRGTLCVSSQAGCALDCAFCSTGKQGFNRNLTAAEIVGQLWHANRALLADGVGAAWVEQGRAPITNVVLMGMGEPLANFDHVVTALRVFLDDNAYGLSRRRVTLSTSGLVPALDRLREACPVALAVSLHAPDDALRDRLVPINRKYPLAELLPACRRYLERAPRDFVTFEYVMLDGVNDSDAQARALLACVARRAVQDQPDPVQSVPGLGVPRRVRARACSRSRRSCMDAGLVATDPQDPRRRHRRRLRTARRPRRGSQQAAPDAAAARRGARGGWRRRGRGRPRSPEAPMTLARRALGAAAVALALESSPAARRNRRSTRRSRRRRSSSRCRRSSRR